MKKIVFLGCLFLVMYGCKPPVPKDIIQPDKMGKILFDIHIVDGYMSTIPIPDTAKKVAASFYKGVYKKFDVDSALFSKSMDFYYKNPEIMNGIYEKIQVDLKKTKANLEKMQEIALKKANKKKLDSAKAADKLKNKLKKTSLKDSAGLKKVDSILKAKKTKLNKVKVEKASVRKLKLVKPTLK